MPVEGRDLGSRGTSEVARAEKLAMSLPTLPKVQQLRETLHAKAKGSPNFRF